VGSEQRTRLGLLKAPALIALLSGVAPFAVGVRSARAEPDVATERYIAMASTGIPLRLTQRDEFGQNAFGPVFSDVLGGYVLPSASRFRHGLGLGASVNLSGDGGYAEPIYSADQIAIMPAYLLYADLGPDWFGLGHLGVPIVVTGGTTAGAEVAAALGYRLFAGAGVFAELALGTFVGAGSTLNPTVALELGLFLDFEVLP
jgi:hypothetical protein